MTNAPNDDLRSEEAHADPHGFFRRLREHDPVHWSEPSGAWIVTGYDDVAGCFKDERLSSDRLGPMETRMSPDQRAAMARTFELLRGWMVFHDPPIHEHLRDPVRREFTPHAVERLAPRIESVVEELLDGLQARGGGDLIADFAFPLPAIVIAELLGVPQHDRERFKRWSTKLSGLVFGAVEQGTRNRAAAEATAEFTDYFTALIRRYEATPADNLISALIAARDRGGGLTDEQLVGACTMLLFGGHETTTTLIGNAVYTLLTQRHGLAALRADASLAASCIEEVLRFEGPAKIMVRHVAAPHERAGHTLARGDRVYLAVAGANRDPAAFDSPDRFEPARDPNPHLAFGLGLHFCLGASLARLESRIAVGRLVDRFPALRFANGEPRWISTIIGRGFASVAIAVG
jgi:cytochrome P450